MPSTYLPKWATAQEAGEWLKRETGEDWPVPRLIHAGAEMGVWLSCADDAPAEIVEGVFGGRREGFIAPVYFGSDRERAEFVRDGGVLSVTQRPDGVPLKFTPPQRFGAEQLKFAATGVRQIAAAVQRGERLDDDRTVTLNIDGAESFVADDAGLAAWIELHGGTAALEGGRVDVINFEGLPVAQPPEPVPAVVESDSKAHHVQVSDHEPVQRAAAQDAAIIASLRAAKHDPLALPKNEAGRPGVKAATRAALGDGGLWAGSTVFQKAWERLTRNKDIAYKA